MHFNFLKAYKINGRFSFRRINSASASVFPLKMAKIEKFKRTNILIDNLTNVQ